MNSNSSQNFSFLLQENPELARRFLVEEQQNFLRNYHEALQKSEIEWLMSQVSLEND